MSIITERERHILIGKIPVENYTKVEANAAVRKLNRFQRAITDPYHIKKVNELIPAAEKSAKAAEKKGKDFDKVFHRRMNQLAIRGGLRV